MSDESTRLRELIQEIGIPLRRLPEIIERTSLDCLNWWSGHIDFKISHKDFSRLATLVGINEKSLVEGQYDRDLAKERLFGKHDSLPERYVEKPNSFLRTSEHIYKYMVLTRGQIFANQVLTEMNVSPLIYQQTDRLINLTYFADLLDTLAQKGFSQHELDTLASVIFLSLKDRPLGHKLEESEDLFEVYSTLAKNYSYFDSNFEYKSEFVGKKYILTTTLPLENHEELKKDPIKVQRLMRYRHILLAWFPYLAGMTPLFPEAQMVSETDLIRTRYEFRLDRGIKRPLQLLNEI